jgi:hypothetical protein
MACRSSASAQSIRKTDGRILIVEARFYAHLNDMLLAGARAALQEAGHDYETITVPGALEIPGAVAMAVETGRYDAFVALGVVIRGETYHFEIVAGESARGLMALALDGLCDRQRHPHRRERGAGAGPRRADAEGQGRRGRQGGAGDAGAQEPVRLRRCDEAAAHPLPRRGARPAARSDRYGDRSRAARFRAASDGDRTTSGPACEREGARSRESAGSTRIGVRHPALVRRQGAAHRSG